MIIDTHVHFYDPQRPEGIPWPTADNELLYRTVLPEHCKALAEPEGVTGVVIVEASAWVEDNQWILDLAEDEPFIVGFVGNLDPGSEDFEANLDRFAANSLFRGIRIGRGRVRTGIAEGCLPSRLQMLAERDLALDVLVGAEEFSTLTLLAAHIPDLRIVIDHVAHVPIDGKAPDAAWVEGIRTLAGYSNVYCKVSALAEMAKEQPAPNDLAYYIPTLDVLWDAFGEDRLTYGSNWPVCERAADYAAVIGIVKEYFEGKGEVACEKYFWRNGKAAYKWVERGQEMEKRV